MTSIPRRAVILAGGRGTRLAPYSTMIPKPLMPIGETPVLELLIQRLQQAGICRIHVAVGHLASMVMEYFGDGKRWGVSMTYSNEAEPLGTAGPLRLAQGLQETFFVVNGDLLTDVDFAAMARWHHARKADATVGVYERQRRLEFGLVETDGDSRLTGYQEKPLQRYLVSMGVYVFEPSVLTYLPEGRFDLPDVIKALLAAGKPVTAYQHHGYWRDIGRLEDYQQAQEEVAAMKPHLSAVQR